MSDLLPPNATQQERAISEAVARIGDVSTPARAMWNFQTCPAALLPWLAWAVSVDEWNADWTEQQKRDTIAASFKLHSTKGTIGALKASLGALGYTLTVTEWFSDPANMQPYTFAVELNIGSADASGNLLNEARALTERAKNTRSHLARLRVVAEPPNVFYAGAGQYLGTLLGVGGQLAPIMSRTAVPLSATAQAVSSAVALLQNRVTEMLAVGGGAPITFDVWNTDSNPPARMSALPTVSGGGGLAASRNGQWVVGGAFSTPFIQIWKRNLTGNTFTKQSDPASLPTASPVAVDISRDSQYVALVNSTGTNIHIYQISGNTFTKLTVPSFPAQATNCRFGPNNILAVAHTTGVRFYQVSGTTVTVKTVNLPTLPSGTIYAVAWSEDGTKLFIGGGVYFGKVFAFDGVDTFTEIFDMGTLPNGPRDADFSRDGRLLAVAGIQEISELYTVSGNTITSIGKPTGITAGNFSAVRFSLDSKKVAFGRESVSTQSIQIFTISGNTTTKLTQAAAEMTNGTSAMSWLPTHV